MLLWKAREGVSDRRQGGREGCPFQMLIKVKKGQKGDTFGFGLMITLRTISVD